MRKKQQLDITNHRIWKDKSINPEAKEIFAELYVEGFERTIAHISIGKVQKQIKSIKNVAFRKNLKQLEDMGYIKFNEYDRGLYEFTIC